MPRPSLAPHMEELEPRQTPATLINPRTVIFRDLDGDQVTVKVTKGILSEAVLQFDTGGIDGNNDSGQKLQMVDLNALAKNLVGLRVSAIAANGGNGTVDVDAIVGSQINVAAVSITGNLGKIDAKNLGSLTVGSLGQAGTQLTSSITKVLGKLKVLGDVTEAQVVAGKSIGLVKINGDLIGGADDGSGSIYSSRSIGRVLIAGSVHGGGGNGSGSIRAVNNIAKVVIGGDLLGGEGADSGLVEAGYSYDDGILGKIGRVTIGGDMIGGAGNGSGSVLVSGNLGPVKIAGDLRGGSGDDSGQISAASVKVEVPLPGGGGYDPYDYGYGYDYITVIKRGNIARVNIGGSLLGGDGERSGRIEAAENLGRVIIGGDVTGGAGTGSASIHAEGHSKTISSGDDYYGDYDIVKPVGGTITKVVIRGNVTGGAGLGSASITASNAIGSVMVTGNWTAASIAAGVGEGSDAFFGNENDDSLWDKNIAINIISIGGVVEGTAAGGDHFGFVAQRINKFFLGGVKVPLTLGAHNNTVDLGTQSDFKLREL